MNYIDKNFYNIIDEIKSKDVYDIYFHILEKFKSKLMCFQREKNIYLTLMIINMYHLK